MAIWEIEDPDLKTGQAYNIALLYVCCLRLVSNWFGMRRGSVVLDGLHFEDLIPARFRHPERYFAKMMEEALGDFAVRWFHPLSSRRSNVSLSDVRSPWFSPWG